jgi:hypothetical protein
LSYRPITDVWFLARAKLKGGRKYYGAYLGGFPERARILIGARITDPVLHVCGGMARLYPYAGGFGPYDKTLDLDPATQPDFLQDAREPFPGIWQHILIDPPYSEPDAEHYVPGRANYPSPTLLLNNALAALPRGGRVGIIHYIVAKPGPKAPPAKFVAMASVACGFNNRLRAFSVWEKR